MVNAAINATGNAGNNALTGNGGDNLLDGGVGADTMRGLAGNDIYVVDDAGDIVDESGSSGSDTVQSSISFSLVISGQLLGTVENLTLTGSGGIDATGNGGANVLTGNSGANVINGGSGVDTLRDMAGNDVLDGGVGTDVLVGGAGSDTFRFTTAVGASNVDTISDLNVAADTLELASAVFSAIAGTTLSAGQFVRNTTGLAQDADDRVIYGRDTGRLFYDSNGNASGGRSISRPCRPTSR